MPPSSDIRIDRDGPATTFILPALRSSAPRFLAFFPILFGFIFLAGALNFMASPFFSSQAKPRPRPALLPGPEAPTSATVPATPPEKLDVHIFKISLALFAIPFLIAGMIPILLGIALLLPSHGEINIANSELIAIRTIGSYRRRTRRSFDQIKELRITSTPTPSPTMQHRFCILVECKEGKPLVLAPGYSHEFLAQLAHALAAEFELKNLHAKFFLPPIKEDPATATPSIITPPQPLAPFVPLDQPAGSTIQFVPTPDSLTFLIPRLGFHGPALFLICFALFWMFISSVLGSGFAANNPRGASFEFLLPLLFISVFFFVGLIILALGIHVAFRRTVILATKDLLVITQKGPLRSTEYQHPPADLTAIRVDYSGTTINNRRLKELQFLDKSGHKKSYFDGRPEPELLWLQSTLQSFYTPPPPQQNP